MQLSPLVLFCYNRPQHVEQTIDALKKCALADQTDLIIFSDGARNEQEVKKVEEVRTVINSVEGFNSVKIIERTENWGLAKSIISGVSEVINEYKRIIVMEDDLVCSESFLTNMNRMLDYFQNHQQIFSITGFNPPISIDKDFSEDLYLFPRTSSYGWGTWVDRWNSVDWSMDFFNSFIQSKQKRKHFNKGGIDLSPMLLHQKVSKINSWAIRFCYAASIQNKMCVYPARSMLYTSGSDGSGTHVTKGVNLGSTASDKIISIDHFPEEHPKISKKVRRFWANSLVRQLINFYKRQVYISLIRL